MPDNCVVPCPLAALRLVACALIALAAGSACKRPPAGSPEPSSTATSASSSSPLSALSASGDDPPAPATRRAPKKSPSAGQRIAIPAGTLVAGSSPGDRGRDPTLEPALQPFELSAFEIDRYPYPNDPSQPPRTDVTRAQAEQLCAERGARLCTELEWERACKGPDNEPFSSGAGWDRACEQGPNGCASGFDVAALGCAIREWTASSVEPGDKDDRPMAAVRGGRPNTADTEHRCARRERADLGAHGPDIGFRCCKGGANAAAISRPKPLQTFRRVQLDPEQLNRMFRGVPQLAGLGRVSFFRDPDDVTLVTSRGDAGRGGNILTTQPLLWSPDLGEEILVVVGKGSSGSSFVAALHRLPDDRYRLASSFVLLGETPPIVLGFNGYTKTRLVWSSCWGCLGEEGAVVYRADRRVVIEQN
jgi:hypothetical protein